MNSVFRNDRKSFSAVAYGSFSHPMSFTKSRCHQNGSTQNELIMTIAVPQGTPVFPAGSPTSSVTFEGFTIAVRGSTDLATFPVTVNPVAPVTTGLPAAPVQGGITYEYRSFSLGGSNGTTGKGFLQVTVTNP